MVLYRSEGRLFILSEEGRRLRIALAGNPNCGKTTVFNRLTGSSQTVGNWPRVTVERKTGWCALGKVEQR